MFSATVVLLTTSFAWIVSAEECVRVPMETELGEIVVEADREHAPKTADNFLAYVDDGFCLVRQFHRTVTMDNQRDDVKIAIIQVSVKAEREPEEFPPVGLKRTTVTGLRHVDGTISMARDEPDSTTSSFFLCIGDQPELDYGSKRNPDGQDFAAFGKVVGGMDVAKKVQMSPHDEQTLVPPVRIHVIMRENSAPSSNSL